jgi:hypothetical protein
MPIIRRFRQEVDAKLLTTKQLIIGVLLLGFAG